MAVSDFGKWLRTLRQSHSLSQRRFAEMLGVHYVYVSQIERGIEIPSESLIRKIAEVFSLSNVDELVLSVGKIPEGIKKILIENPSEAPVLLRQQVEGDFVARQRIETFKKWRYNCSNGLVEFPVIDEIKAMKHRGYDVSQAEMLIQEGHELYAAEDAGGLLKHIAIIRKTLRESRMVKTVEFETPDDFCAIKRSVSPEALSTHRDFDADSQNYINKVSGGWLGKCIGGALGLPVEGWPHAKILNTYGEVTDYLVKPTTVNDDTAFQIVFLHAIEEYGVRLTSEDIALEWVEHIPLCYTAEEIALGNLKKGIMPPLSATRDNPYTEWIGAQMRGEVCGLIAPGRPDIAIEYAYKDAIISHAGEGVYGEMYNAALISLAFVESDVRRLIERGLSFIPPKSRYAKLIREVLEWARCSKSWREAWSRVEQSYLSDYYWVHSFPNTAAIIIGLWFGNGDFENTICITMMCGLDTDCTVGQSGATVGTILGCEGISDKWRNPIDDTLDSEVVGFEQMSIQEISTWTAQIGKLVLRNVQS